MEFEELVVKAHVQKGTPSVPQHFVTLCFDPGHTTGWAAFQGFELVKSGQIDTTSVENAASEVARLIKEYPPDLVVMEDYRVYKWRAKHHVGSEMLTTRIIGCIETICIINSIFDIIKQPAHIAKGFCTDKRLREWGFYVKGERHARDAIRHGCYYLIFGAITKKQRAQLTVG